MNDQKPYPFQSATLNWLREREFRGLVAHEMGLGKTVIACEAIKELAESGKRGLILAPGATIPQWQRMFHRWTNDMPEDDLDIKYMLQTLSSSRSALQLTRHANVLLMSHNLMARKDVVQPLAKWNPEFLIIDEAHQFGADSSKRLTHLHALRNLSEAKFESGVILLTGTPIRNYAREIYNLANLLDPLEFRNSVDFARRYLTWDRKALSRPHQFHADFGRYYLRYTVSEVQKDLPEIRRTKLYTEITNPFIRSAYNAQVDLMTNFMKNAEKIEAFSLLGYLVKLRHITGIAKATEPSIIEPMAQYLSEGNRAVVGLHHHLVYERLRRSLKEFPAYLIRGGMNPTQKDQEKYRFINSPEGSVCYVSIKAAGMGIDGLQHAAHKAYVFERQWNGADEIQFEKRIHRDGQKHPVHIEYTIGMNTVDEFFDEMVEMKRRITTQVEDQNWESNPAFLKQLAERVIANKLPEPSAAELKDFEENLNLNLNAVEVL